MKMNLLVLTSKSKRANVWINLLVILTLATTLVAGYTFLTSSAKIEAEIAGTGVLNDVYLEKNEFSFYVQQAGEKAIEETYLQLKEDEEPTPYSFFNNFQRQFNNYGINGGYLKRENFVLNEGEEVLKFKIDNWQTRKELNLEENNIEVLYKKEMNFEFDLK